MSSPSQPCRLHWARLFCGQGPSMLMHPMASAGGLLCYLQLLGLCPCRKLSAPRRGGRRKAGRGAVGRPSGVVGPCVLALVSPGPGPPRLAAGQRGLVFSTPCAARVRRLAVGRPIPSLYKSFYVFRDTFVFVGPFLLSRPLGMLREQVHSHFCKLRGTVCHSPPPGLGPAGVIILHAYWVRLTGLVLR